MCQLTNLLPEPLGDLLLLRRMVFDELADHQCGQRSIGSTAGVTCALHSSLWSNVFDVRCPRITRTIVE